jgi:hypothetical protein
MTPEMTVGYYLAISLLTIATKYILDSFLTILDIYPQVHGAIIVAFHLEIHLLQILALREYFRYRLFIFSQRKALIKSLVWI